MTALKKTTFTVALFLSLAGFGQHNNFLSRLADSALRLTHNSVVYDPSYYTLAYPGGDVPSGRGVCTDVIIRAFRMVGIDLQKEVHTDMKTHFHLYPKIWGLKQPDKNIDHRRVPNLMTYFERAGAQQPISNEASDYLPGDVVCWDLGKGVTHIGLVSKLKSADGKRHLIIHNIGAGQVVEDCLQSFTIIGHYRYLPSII